jgi:hypothetical protein
MSRIHVTATLALLALAGAASTAVAQQRGEGIVLEACQGAPGGSRARRNCEQQPARAQAPTETRIAVEAVPLPTTRQCEAGAATEYFQRNTNARVTSTISVATCAAANGAFKVALRIRDDAGEVKTLEFDESWQRTEQKDVVVAKDYPIGENVELVNARVRGLSCTCASPADAPVAQ